MLQEWCAGDVIGSCIDVDSGTVSYYRLSSVYNDNDSNCISDRNGKDLGVAFRNVRQGPGYAYFPAISNGPREECTANFGNTPFRCVHLFACVYMCAVTAVLEISVGH